MISRHPKFIHAAISLLLALSVLLTSIPLWAKDTVDPAIACGDNHMLALQDDGTVWAWGLNTSGQIGDGSVTDRLIPVKITDDGSQVFAYGDSSFVLKNDGIVWGWGKNFINGSSTANGDKKSSFDMSLDRMKPMPISGLYDIQSLSVAYPTAIALTSTGNVIDFSASFDTGIFDAAKTRSTRLNSLANVKAIAAGNGHGLALCNDGVVWAWGANDRGQLGISSIKDKEVYFPVKVETLNNVVAIAAGRKYSIALKSDGTVWAWGDNTRGQLGNGLSEAMVPMPTRIQGLSNVIKINGGQYHALALCNNGKFYSWGDNSFGQLGNTGAPNRPGLAVETITNLSSVFDFSAGGYGSAALTNDDSIWVWGRNEWGQLGTGTFGNQNGPVKLRALSTGIPVTDFYFTQSQLVATTAQKITLRPTILPSNATNKSISWSSSNTDIAVVEDTGVLVPKAPGKCIITAISKDTGLKAVCNVIIGLPVRGIAISFKSASLIVGGPYLKITPTVIPTTAVIKTVIWKTSNPKVATVDWFGVVKPVGVGTAQITAETQDGGYKAVCTVTVKPSSKTKAKK